MILRLVITINMSGNIIEHFKNVPDAGPEMVSRIISGIDADKQIKLIRYQVLVVLGKLTLQNNANAVSMLRNWSISWSHSYFLSGNQKKITKKMDKAVCTIIRTATREMLWKFYSWDSPSSNFYN